MNEPHFSIFEKMSKPKVHALPIEEVNYTEKIKQNYMINNENIDNVFDFKDKFLLSIFQNVSAKIITDNIKIINILHNSYQEIYTFEKNNETCRASFSYNSKDIVTNISFVETNELSKALGILLSSIKGHLISTAIKDTFVFNEDFLEEFHLTLKDVLNASSISIANIEHNNWMERYTFTRENEIAVIDFYYNKKGQFKSPTPSSRSNSTQLVKSVLDSF